MIKAQNLVKKFGDFTAVKDISFTSRQAKFSPFWAQWRRQNHHHQDADHAAAPDQRPDRTRRSGPDDQQKQARQRFGIVFQDPSLDSEQTA